MGSVGDEIWMYDILLKTSNKNCRPTRKVMNRIRINQSETLTLLFHYCATDRCCNVESTLLYKEYGWHSTPMHFLGMQPTPTNQQPAHHNEKEFFKFRIFLKK